MDTMGGHEIVKRLNPFLVGERNDSGVDLVVRSKRIQAGLRSLSRGEGIILVAYAFGLKFLSIQ